MAKRVSKEFLKECRQKNKKTTKVVETTPRIHLFKGYRPDTGDVGFYTDKPCKDFNIWVDKTTQSILVIYKNKSINLTEYFKTNNEIYIEV